MSSMRDVRQIESTASRTFTRRYMAAFGIAALIGLGVGVIWVIAGILHFHPLW
jgi:hypothetical protein